MGWRTLFISEPCKLKLADNNLILTQQKDNVPISIPLSDIDTIVLESLQSSITSLLLSKIVEYKIAFVICGNNFTPNGILYHMGAHCRNTKVAKAQVLMSQEQKDLLWQQILRQKIINQANTIKAKIHDQKAYLKLMEYADNVSPGDKEFVEGYAAAFYFSKLFPQLRRRRENLIDIRDSALNYGYAILRSCISRSLTVTGLLPMFGIKHDNELNAFNLTDDMIEPFRSLVDCVVYDLFDGVEDFGDFLQKEHKVALLSILSQKCSIENQNKSVSMAIETMCESLKKAALTGKNEIILPKI
ncbi:MAG: type II CRISPR-associated endonuclease Cas1 [Erysipelotrichia bacterium]|nr:type II CRISPR-associated endonuclease Cas1 [Erysipelotrichia bacterium]